MPWMVVLLLALLLGGCTKKKAGEACERGQCSDGLVCDAPRPVVCRTCKSSYRCIRDGLCTYRDGSCWATSEQDCKTSEHCTRQGYCRFVPDKGYCVNERDLPHWEDDANKEGGCPCGCDHSEEMLAELRDESPAAALDEARRSIATIGEREQAGYITEAMVCHRLRLRALEGELGAEPLTVDLLPGAEVLAQRRRSLPPVEMAGLRLRQELLVFGATTERVNGHLKDLDACFRLWLELETDQPRSLALPRLTGSLPFDVKRWYPQGGDGAPWDGQLEPGEPQRLLVIGYLGGKLAPGTRVEAQLEIDGATTPLPAVVALGRWDAALPRPPVRRSRR